MSNVHVGGKKINFNNTYSEYSKVNEGVLNDKNKKPKIKYAK